MRFLADMGVSLKTVIWLRQSNHDAVHLREDGLQQLSDPLVLEKAYTENRILLTFDLDFGQLMAASKQKLPSVVVFRLNDGRSQNQIIKLEQVIKEASLALINGAVISVEESNFRVRHTPINQND